MSSITRPAATMNDALRMLASNLQSDYKVKATLELLATRYIMHPGAKDAARRLVAFCNRLEKSAVAPPTTTVIGISRKRPNTDAIENLISCKRRKAVEAARIKDSEEKRRRQLIAIEEYKQQRLQAVRFEGSDLKENQKPIKPKTGRGNCFKRRF
ncbi:hypothetical protein L3Y34_013000 [Caenorhabditis briggsae]|uniref:Uncharacterized protein n=1 Tax=Caenorhabditis briggsae TaxID=6238 RepID=A0AAE9CX49_CAEBR|nr:hypothetical protein L3Y34_013000 [Caenorhabditis briggsae]